MVVIFENPFRIGPFGLKRYDLLIASIVISFRTGSPRVRIYCFLVLLAELTVAIGAFFRGSPVLGLGILALATYTFLVGPMLRFRAKNHGSIVLEVEEHGLTADVAAVRITYKGPEIGKATVIAHRLVIMISGRLALVVPERVTTLATLNAFKNEIDRRRVGAGKT